MDFSKDINILLDFVGEYETGFYLFTCRNVMSAGVCVVLAHFLSRETEIDITHLDQVTLGPVSTYCRSMLYAAPMHNILKVVSRI